MVKKHEKQQRKKFKNRIRADIIILGCSLPGIVAAHNLKKKFGNTMDIVVLDLASTMRTSTSKLGVAFAEEDLDDKCMMMESTASLVEIPTDIENVARYYIAKTAREFNMPLPGSIVHPAAFKTSLKKMFQYRNGAAVECSQNFHDFGYLNFVERFELEQYQNLLDHSAQNLFHAVNTDAETKKLLYYDQTTMEDHMCKALLLPTSREIMRTIIKLVCGTTANNVSVLFYLHQCHRTNSCRNHVDGDNTRIREKVVSYCRKRLANKLQQSVADITLTTKAIREIRTYADEQVILEPVIGETDYICTLLAMAVRPDQLRDIQLETQLLSEQQAEITKRMIQGNAKKFLVQYEESFWRRDGYSGDILSVRGPIIWAMEQPNLAATGKVDKYATLVGYMMPRDDVVDSREAVLEQLVKLFGEEAATPTEYIETDFGDIFVPRCGDYVALRGLIMESSPKFLEWGALDIFADGDLGAAIEAGNTAYLHVLSCLRPQAMTYDDMALGDFTARFDSTYAGMSASVNILSTTRILMCGIVLVIGVQVLRSILQK
ncbi:uncharacterized protein LOC126378308 [Pectinophora gossypiella]|uniref:uncharacterized protein LOC126378308 n=1 Tax=Pectinophora gossypiella TaxID=13191 RepID=UPI00214E28C0|nr:uncharacterized protein LOC126378308 [Pectinophora gossypiella]